MTKGKFAVVFKNVYLGVVEGETPLDARLEAASRLRNLGQTVDSLEAFELRFLSGFPEFTAGELRFGHEVKPGDSFQDQHNVTETIIRNAKDLEGVTRSWPPGTAATPPFRAHENSPGCWTIPAFAESRQASREAILGSVDDDRLAGVTFSS
jgi:hypothetical protein